MSIVSIDESENDEEENKENERKKRGGKNLKKRNYMYVRFIMTLHLDCKIVLYKLILFLLFFFS